jgi:type II secretory pathway component PulF
MKAAWLPGRIASRRESMAVVRLLAACAPEGSDPSRLLRAWAVSERRRQADRVVRFASVLGGTRSLEAAVDAEPGCLADLDRTALRFAGRSGLVREVLERRIAVWEGDRTDGRLRVVAGYTLFMTACFLVVSGFIGWTILPKYEQILADFGMRPDASMRLARGVAAAVAAVWSTAFVVAAAAIVFAFLPRARLGTLVLDLFAVASGAGRRPDDTARLVGDSLEDRRLSRLLVAAAEGAPGGSVAEMLVRSGCVRRREAAFLERAEVIGGAEWALTAIARSHRDAHGRYWDRLEEVMVPVAAVLLGGLVLVEAAAILSPLVELVRGLS